MVVRDQPFDVVLKENSRARRLSLRVDAARHCVVLVKPHRVSRAAALAFALERADWITDRLAELADPVPFLAGQSVPILGDLHVIEHVPDARRGVWQDQGRLFVSGQCEYLPRRVKDWFKTEARKLYSPLAHSYAGKLEKNVSRISVRDQRSRWGSCTGDGALSFSWRLMMTPPYVVEYVIAHEVAHLSELNHSARFWSTVEKLTEHRAAATQWLARHGLDLHRYGTNA